MFCIRLKYLFLLIFFPLFTIYSQSYYFKKYATSDGLIQGTVRTISQDSFGRMWFGTAEGVSIYDGTNYYNYGMNEGLPVPVITGFLEIVPGIMLVGTSGGGIVIFEKLPFRQDTIKAILTDKEIIISPFVNQMFKDQQGNIWICTDEGITQWVYDNGNFVRVKNQSEFGNFGKQSIYMATTIENGERYFATETGLIKEANNNYERIYFDALHKEEPVFSVYRDKSSRIWFSSNNKLFYIKNGNVFDYTKIHPDLNAGIVAFEENEKGEFLFGTLGRIFIVGKSRTEIIDKKNGLQERNIISIFYDKEENLWIGSLEGLSKLTNTNLRFVEDIPMEVYFTSKVALINDKLLIGSNAGLFEINNFELIPSHYAPDLGKIRINEIDVFNNNTWFATENGVFIKSKTGIKKLTTFDGLPNNFIYSFVIDTEGTVWIATQSGLAYYKNGNIFNFNDRLEKEWNFSDTECNSVLSAVSLRRLIVDQENNIWIGSWDGGLLKIKNDSVYRFTLADGLIDLHIRGLYIDNEKRLWIGTRYGGVFYLKNNRFYQLTVKDGLSSNWVFSITEDNSGSFWFSTANGINKYDGTNFIKFDASEGITSAEIIYAIKYDDELWFNSWNQIFSYKTTAEKKFNLPPGIHFSQIKLLSGNLPEVNNLKIKKNYDLKNLLKTSQPENQLIKLSYDENTLFFEFAGSSFHDESKIKYDYILEGFDKEWIRSTRRNYANYTHLPPGDYSFKVNAINGYGIKSNSPAEFTFTILPPYWQTWWFISSVVFLSLFITSAVSIFLYRIRVKQKLKVERMRTKIATDLHDDIGTSLSSIAIFSQLAKRELKGDRDSACEYIEKIESTSRNLIDAMSNIVWSINPLNDSPEDAFMKMKDYSVKILEAKNIDTKFFISEKIASMNLQPDLRRNLLLIFKEAVTNAAKYSEASEVKIALGLDETTGDKIIFTIEDNGIGFDAKQIFIGNGLKNIRRRSDEVNAELELISSPGKGTKITVKMPID